MKSHDYTLWTYFVQNGTTTLNQGKWNKLGKKKNTTS
jgi:hypothetical protein